MKRIAIRKRGGQRSAAFTLIEVVAALTILALITGAVYALLHQSIQAAADLQDSERQDQSLRRFLDLCRATLETLPPEATFSLASAEETGTAAELTVSGAPEAFSVGPEPVASSDLVLGLRIAASEDASGSNGNSVYQVAISREEFAPVVHDGDFQVRASSDDAFFQPDEQGRYWLPLLNGIRSLEWRYWNEDDRIWEDDWSEAPDRPTLVEMQLWPDNRAAPLRAVFSIPTSLPMEDPEAGSAASGGAGSRNAPEQGNREGPPVPGARRSPEGQGPENAGRDGAGRQGPPGGAQRADRSRNGQRSRGNRPSGAAERTGNQGNRSPNATPPPPASMSPPAP